MLSIDGLRSGYGKSEALHGVSMDIEAGTVVTIIGANGAGKSTLVNTVSGLVPAMSGRMSFEGRDITDLAAADIVDLGIVQVPEGRKLFGPLTVEENLELGAYRSRSVKASEIARRRAFVFELFPRLAERAGQRAATLSGGEQQMVAMGRALMAQPKLLLLDEPSLGLAPIIVDRVFDTLAKLKGDGMTMLLVEQRADMALAIADFAYVMATGRIVANGPTGAMRADTRVQQAYLGEAGVFEG